MKLYVIGLSVNCETCGWAVYSEKQEDGTPTVKCINEGCAEYNKDFILPSFELKPYVAPKETP